jgi:ubiquitin fusion degradation protein 1
MAAGGGGWGLNQGPRPHPRAYDEHMKAYSIAMVDGKVRDHLNYGGKSG